MRKILFLDIDGVIAVRYNERKFWPDHNASFDAVPLRNLTAICDAHPDVDIVISSTWRISKTVEELRQIFAIRGFRYYNNILDKTPRCTYQPGRPLPEATNFKGAPRGLEIEWWIKENISYNDPYAFAIIDDDGDMLLWHRYNFVQPKSLQGLTKKQANEVIWILNQDSLQLYRGRGKIIEK